MQLYESYTKAVKPAENSLVIYHYVLQNLVYSTDDPLLTRYACCSFLPLNYCKLESLFIQYPSVTCHVRMFELPLKYRILVPRMIRALASARGSVARRAQKHRRLPLEGPKGPRVAETRESEGPKGPRTSKAQSSFRRLPVLLYMFFTIQPKIAIFMAQFKYLNDGQNA